MGSLANNLNAAIAFNRFGLGGRPDDVVPTSPTSWLTNQLIGPDPCTGAGLMNTAAGLAQYAIFRAADHTSAQSGIKQQISQGLSNEIGAYLLNATTTRLPFRERLVQFWANHFALMANHAAVGCCAGAYIREAIRPYVNGTFTQMLLAVMQHPAMLFNLNNNLSTGPQSTKGQRCQASGCVSLGINENLARECLELHTVGINAGYTQADVDALAMLLTGWTVNVTTAPLGFSFDATAHQPGTQVLMGQTFAAGQAGGIAALTWLATHPLTYQHIATKLVTHFVSDTPSSSDIAAVVNVLSNTGGNLAAAANAVVGLPSAWVPMTKLRTPQDYVIAVLRAAGVTTVGSTTVSSAAVNVLSLGQPVWQPVFPNGFSDLASDWASPAQMVLRTDWINALCTTLTLDPNALMANSLGPLLSSTTQSAVNAARSNHDKLSLLFLSPEFQRR